MRTLSLLLLVLSYGILHAQSNFRPGYIITNENDTIIGLVDYRTDQMNALTCSFKKTETSSVKTYLPGNIAGFRFTEDGKFYVSRGIVINNTPVKVFLEYLIKGMMNLYFYSDVATKFDYYIFETQNGEMQYITKRPDEIQKMGGDKFLNTKYFLVKDIRYKSDVKNIFEDIPELEKETKDIHFSHDAMISVTKNYHNLTCTTGEPCIEFVTKPDKRYIKCKFSIYGGVFPSTTDGIFHFFPIIGGQVNFSIPRADKSLSISLDLSWTGHPLPISNPIKPERVYLGFALKQSALSLMMGIRYTYHKGIIRPFVEGGVLFAYTKRDIIYNYIGWVEETGSNGETYMVERILYDSSNKLSFSIGLNSFAGVNFKVGRDSFIFLSAGFIYAKNYLCQDIQFYPRLTLGYTF